MAAIALKWIALITMLIDHIGLVFFPQFTILRMIGRISFPIFAFLLVQSFTKTKSRFMFGARLLAFAFISEIPYDLCMSNRIFNPYAQNIMFELFFGFCTLLFLEKAIKKNPLYIFVTIIFAVAPVFLYCSYGLYGIAIILGFYIFRSFRGADVLSFLGITYLFYGFTNWSFSFDFVSYQILSLNTLQMYCMLASIPIVFYNGKRGKYTLKWLFYTIYPVHLIVIYFCSIYLPQIF